MGMFSNSIRDSKEKKNENMFLALSFKEKH